MVLIDIKLTIRIVIILEYVGIDTPFSTLSDLKTVGDDKTGSKSRVHIKLFVGVLVGIR